MSAYNRMTLDEVYQDHEAWKATIELNRALAAAREPGKLREARDKAVKTWRPRNRKTRKQSAEALRKATTYREPAIGHLDLGVTFLR
ncbi:hypothetical protein UFOVP650_40 [uncultured Caudovirales phage]|uniref:Uncharacterized protein n=1 Tax=uncultured Caudovirales phage TaxID=2100421 RepID=A0A6J5N7V2_9CAUD|nr:hypothetical protein UFOVP650_40 [uncultured Caudovirales phage]